MIFSFTFLTKYEIICILISVFAFVPSTPITLISVENIINYSIVLYSAT